MVRSTLIGIEEHLEVLNPATSSPCQDPIIFEMNRMLQIAPNPQASTPFKSRLLQFAQESVSSSDVNFNVFKYWQERSVEGSPCFSEIAKVAQIILGASPTQVSVERGFSFFSLMYTHLRTRLKPDLIFAILFLKGNLDMLKSCILINFSNEKITISDEDNILTEDDEEEPEKQDPRKRFFSKIPIKVEPIEHQKSSPSGGIKYTPRK